MSSTSGIGGTLAPTDQEIPRTLARQLHQTTQPLSVLQGLLELALIESRSVDDYRRSVELSLVELGRVTDCFDELRRLVAASQNFQSGAQGSGRNRV